MKNVRVAIVGSRGYSGLEVSRILLNHPKVQSVGLFATSAFEPADTLPELKPGQIQGQALSNLLEAPQNYDCAFLALPHEASLDVAPRLLKAGLHVIDLSGAFRLQSGSDAENIQMYKTWYKLEHTEAALLKQAHYGLIPFQAPQIAKTPTLVSNPGCYATAVSLALIPLLKAGLADSEFIAVDAKSGTTGAGKKAEEKLLFSEVADNCLPYKVSSHQHQPEIQMALERFGGRTVDMSFTPHLLPTRRGIIASIYTKVPAGTTETSVGQAFAAAYENYPLVRLSSLATPGSERDLKLSRVVGSPRTHITWKLDGRRLTVFTLIDNLLKGAASQAVENFNGLYGWDLTMGLAHKEGLL